MESKPCLACGQGFVPRPQVSHQTYCDKDACQRERRRRWQRAKRKSDRDYYDNQARVQQAWRERHRDYWREYRRAHPQYAQRNRTQQRGRDARRCERRLAKMDVCTRDFPVPSGTYRLTPTVAGNLAKMDAWTVELTLLSNA